MLQSQTSRLPRDEGETTLLIFPASGPTFRAKSQINSDIQSLGSFGIGQCEVM